MSKYECYILGDGGSRVPINAVDLKRLVLNGSISGDTIVEVNGRAYLARKIVPGAPEPPCAAPPTAEPLATNNFTPNVPESNATDVPQETFSTNQNVNTAIWSVVVIVAVLIAFNIWRLWPRAAITLTLVAESIWLAPWFVWRKAYHMSRLNRLIRDPAERQPLFRYTATVLIVTLYYSLAIAGGGIVVDVARNFYAWRDKELNKQEQDSLPPAPASAQTYSPPTPKVTSELAPIFIEAPPKVVDAQPSFRLKTNLPDGTKVMIALVDGSNRRGDSAVVSNGIIETTTFSNLGADLPQGEYQLEISTPVVQSPKIISIVGKRGENYRGSLVSEIDFFGSPARVIEAQAVVTVEESSTSQTSARQHFADFDVETTREEAAALYDELIEFKSAPAFHQLGFGSGGPYSQWLESQQALSKRIPKGAPIGSEISSLGIAVGYLQTCAFEYMKSRGQETDFTKTVMPEVRATLNK